MLSNKIEKAINKQINHEFTTAYTYLAMSAWFASKNLSGFAHWMHVQHQEELTHAAKLFDFVIDRGGRVELEAIGKPKGDYSSPKDAVAAALKLEQTTTALINNLYGLGAEEKDYATHSRLQWFVDEQVEEEKSVSEILAKLEMAGASNGTVLMIDHHLSKRGKS
ncbi:MAG: ferritin [Verrucomicrobia bacterium]|nr:ferritin [Verrucomicrobiota bacterium]